MMTRKRWLLVLLLVGCAGAFTFWLLWPHTAITRENAAKIQVGMNLAQVEAILGGPATETLQWPEDVDESLVKHWSTSDASILVCFDSNGLVCHTHFGAKASDAVWWQILQWFGFRRATEEVAA